MSAADIVAVSAPEMLVVPSVLADSTASSFATTAGSALAFFAWELTTAVTAAALIVLTGADFCGIAAILTVVLIFSGG